MAMSVKQDAVWDAIKPRVIEQARALLKLNCDRYKAYYNIIKHDLVAAEGKLADHPTLNDASLERNYQRAQARSVAFNAQLEIDTAYLDTLEDACLKENETDSLLIITKTRENINDLKSYNQHHKPSLAQIDAAYQNRRQIEPQQVSQPEQAPGA